MRARKRVPPGRNSSTTVQSKPPPWPMRLRRCSLATTCPHRRLRALAPRHGCASSASRTSSSLRALPRQLAGCCAHWPPQRLRLYWTRRTSLHACSACAPPRSFTTRRLVELVNDEHDGLFGMRAAEVLHDTPRSLGLYTRLRGALARTLGISPDPALATIYTRLVGTAPPRARSMAPIPTALRHTGPFVGRKGDPPAHGCGGHLPGSSCEHPPRGLAGAASKTEEWADERRSMSARGPRQGPTGKVPRRSPRHGKRPPGVADGVGLRADHVVVTTPLLRT